MEEVREAKRPDYMFVVIEDPDGITYTQSVNNDFDDLLHLKKSLGPDFWIVDIYDPV